MIFTRINKELRKKKKLEKIKQWHTRFALLPKRIDPQTIVWLEVYYQILYQNKEAIYESESFTWKFRTKKQHFEDKLKE